MFYCLHMFISVLDHKVKNNIAKQIQRLLLTRGKCNKQVNLKFRINKTPYRRTLKWCYKIFPNEFFPNAFFWRIEGYVRLGWWILSLKLLINLIRPTRPSGKQVNLKLRINKTPYGRTLKWCYKIFLNEFFPNAFFRRIGG